MVITEHSSADIITGSQEDGDNGGCGGELKKTTYGLYGSMDSAIDTSFGEKCPSSVLGSSWGGSEGR